MMNIMRRAGYHKLQQLFQEEAFNDLAYAHISDYADQIVADKFCFGDIDNCRESVFQEQILPEFNTSVTLPCPSLDIPQFRYIYSNRHRMAKLLKQKLAQNEWWLRTDICKDLAEVFNTSLGREVREVRF